MVGMPRRACRLAAIPCVRCIAVPSQASLPLRCSDEHKVRAALALVSSHDGQPLRLELQ